MQNADQSDGSIADDAKLNNLPVKRKLSFYTENGHIWRQAEASGFAYPKNKSFKVTIKRTFMGGYKLKIDGAKVSTSVKRIE